MQDAPVAKPIVPELTGTVLYAALATMLVFNSHLESIYPYRWLAGDGLLGNCMFYFLSAWGLAKSWAREQRGVLDYCARRWLRLYPPLIIAVLVLDFWYFRRWQTTSLGELWASFAYPTAFTYYQVIIPGYLALYVLLRTGALRYWHWMIAALVLAYAYNYASAFAGYPKSGLSLGLVPEPAHYYYYAIVILLGAAHGAGYLRHFGPRYLALPLVFLYLAAKFFITTRDLGLYYPVLHLTCGVALGSFFGAMPNFLRWFPTRGLQISIAFVGAHSLEIYLTHSLLLNQHWIEQLQTGFVWKLAVLALTTLVASWLLHQLHRWFMQTIGQPLAIR